MIIEKYRAKGLKMTPQRVAVFENLYGDETHPSAETIHQRVCETMPSVSLRTVYQVLNDLSDMGEVGTLNLGTGPIRFDPNTEDHQHFICSLCETVYDVSVKSEAVLSNGQDFRIAEVNTLFRGLCPACSK